MAFSFGNNAAAGGAAGGTGGLTQGSDLEVIVTEGLGFLALASDAKVQLTSRWSPPPAPTASLLSIAPRKGLVAAAGADAVHIATTDSVRKAFEAERSGDSEVRPFNPEAKVPLPFRISQLAFTADEQFLLLSAESGGGLAAYDVQTLVQGGTQSAFELNTNGESIRALVPNPMPELASFCAIVTNNGNLFMANLAECKLNAGPNGPTLRSQVSCAAWSTKGKQLVAGMADGTIYQMTPDGTEKGHIPKPPSLGDYHVSSVTWLENNVFLVIHNPANGQDPSVYHIITRQAPPGGTLTFTFQKLTDPVELFGSNKVPHHSVLRLKDFPPNLQDLLLVSSTATETIGILSRSKTPLSSDKPAEAITNVFTTTELADDSRRAQLPMSEDLAETFPVGTALDLSGKDKVYKPIPTDEMEQSPGPLPGLWILNNEGVLAVWWTVYNESILSGTTYPGLVAADAGVSAQPAAVKSSLPSTFASPAGAPAFGAPSSAAPAFGGASAIGANSSPWSTGPVAPVTPSFGSSTFGSAPAAAAPAFGAPSFGSKPAGPAFGQSSTIGMGLGTKVSPWATGSPSAAAPAFGQSGFSGAGGTPSKVFGSAAAAAPTSGGFAGFATKSGFGGLTGSPSGPGLFGSKPSGAFASTTPEVSMDSDTAFPPSRAKENSSTFGSSPFVLGTTFKADPEASEDNEKPKLGAGSSLFGSNFGLSLTDAAKQPVISEVKDEDMDSTAQTPAPNQEKEKAKTLFGFESTTPTTTPAPPKFTAFQPTSGSSAGSSIFGQKPSTSSGTSNIFGTPKSAAEGSKPSPVSSIFGTPKPASAAPISSLFGTPKIKKEDEDKENLADIPEAPLPPDATSKAVFHLSDSSSHSGSSYSPEAASQKSLKVGDAPLPPDFLGKPVPTNTKEASPSQKLVPKEAPLPPDFIPNKSDSTSKPFIKDDAPLPPDFVVKPASQPLPEAPAVPSSPEQDELSEEGELSEDDQEDDEEGEDGTDAASEGSGIDVAKDLSPTAAFGNRTPGFTPQSSFGGMGGSTFSTISRSEAEQPRTLFGEISRNAPPLFAQPVPQSPRSPSPVRGASRASVLRTNETPRSVSAPGMASQILGRRPPTSQGNLAFSTTARSSPPIDPNVQAQRKHAAKKEAEVQVLVDPEDDGIQQILRSEVHPTLEMNEFLAVDTKLETIDASTNGREVPVACETLWRDINRMVDRVGLNSRSLQSFVLGHTTQFKESSRDKEDLENPDDWVLVEVEDLSIVENELAKELQEGRLRDVEETRASIQDLTRDLAKLRVKEEDMRKVIMSHIDPEQLAVARSLPLSAEQATQQNELRRAYATFSKLLAETEEALTMLKAKISSAGGASGKAQVPTVEAIIRTINKMTGMAEKRSGDIDILENQMRRLRLGSMGLNDSPGPRSREDSPYKTPQKRSILSPERMRDSMTSSIASYGMRGTPPRKKMSMYSEEEKQAVRQKSAKRQGTLERLRSSLERSGPNISRLKDDD
ncbi:hypothetical protein B0T24DRAFT_516480 [Lasiosphaeria ovina]|uniref:Nucleoporin Nup159/Nup146 N-terminal domain-containing protein n=1 Tax=Lasiosphaeria ovina TaxID=92902 RepID=A0AAE0NKR4_9PEZI|nr:hypothetical protein B0T24DRAFT_516480 [Lasiosphaeria ovina]